MYLAAKGDLGLLRKLKIDLSDCLYFSVGTKFYQEWRQRSRELATLLKENRIELGRD